MHFNANAARQQATTEDGDLQWKIARPRATHGVPVAKPVKEMQTRSKTSYFVHFNDTFYIVSFLVSKCTALSLVSHHFFLVATSTVQTV